MADTLLPDDPQTLQRLDSVACLLDWMQAMPAPMRKRFLGALANSGDANYQVVARQLVVIKDSATTPADRQQAFTAIADALLPNADDQEAPGLDLAASVSGSAAENLLLARDIEKLDTQQATFAERLREVMEAKRVSQQELANRVGVSQPAISQMLNRDCRPQKKTILKMAEALNVQACDLWPDIDVVELLDAVTSFQEDGYVMTEAEARALGATAPPNRPKVEAKSLPSRRR